MNFHVITLFPEVCKTYTDSSILGRAQKTHKGKGSKIRGKKISVQYYNPRDFSANKHNKVDDRPYGGGPGMVMQAEPILKAWQKAVGRKVQSETKSKGSDPLLKSKKAKSRVKTLIMSPRGKVFTNKVAKDYAKKYDHLVLISGRYEGIDARVKKILGAEEVSVGDYVLTGGELPALAIIDATSRQVPGVLGEFDSLEDDKHYSGECYTRPEVIEYKKKKYKVPPVFMSGHHKEIEKRRAK